MVHLERLDKVYFNQFFFYSFLALACVFLEVLLISSIIRSQDPSFIGILAILTVATFFILTALRAVQYLNAGLKQHADKHDSPTLTPAPQKKMEKTFNIELRNIESNSIDTNDNNDDKTSQSVLGKYPKS